MIDSRAANALNQLKLRLAPLVTSVAYEEPFRQFVNMSRGLEGELFLDGADDLHRKGSCSVIAAAPLFIVRVKNNLVTFKSRSEEITFSASPLEVIVWLENFNAAGNGSRFSCFDGGLVFLLSYELNRYYEKSPSLRQNAATSDDLWCGFYPNVRLFDSVSRKAWELSYCEPPSEQLRHSASRENLQYTLSGFQCGESRENYISKIENVKRYIEAGDIYQANISRKLVSDFSGSALALYGDLRNANPAEYGAFINGGDFQILSLSPELFFSVRGSSIETRPIKGTAPRSENPEEDERFKAELVGSEKERAENIMIVDLMRNDLSKICKPHSVTVSSLLECESLPTVHHLVSTIRGELSSGNAKLSRILAACFPGGSVTGAPKLRAMEIIAEMESSPRSFYCGSIAACGLNGTITASLLIRTLTVTDSPSGMSGEAVYQTGGGITAGSDPEREFKETRHKAAMLGAALRKPALANVR